MAKLQRAATVLQDETKRIQNAELNADDSFLEASSFLERSFATEEGKVLLEEKENLAQVDRIKTLLVKLQ